MCVMLQDFAAALQHPDLALCRKDVNALLGEMDPDAATLDYQSIAPEVYELLSARMVVSSCGYMWLMSLPYMHHQDCTEKIGGVVLTCVNHLVLQLIFRADW